MAGCVGSDSVRVEPERAAARAELAVVYRTEWWERAGVEDIGRACITARAWGDVDPEAHRADQRIQGEVRARHGVDLATATADPAAVRYYAARADGPDVRAQRIGVEISAD